MTSRDGDGVILFCCIIPINAGICPFCEATKNNLQKEQITQKELLNDKVMSNVK
jgi:glutaredoxin